MGHVRTMLLVYGTSKNNGMPEVLRRAEEGGGGGKAQPRRLLIILVLKLSTIIKQPAYKELSSFLHGCWPTKEGTVTRCLNEASMAQ